MGDPSGTAFGIAGLFVLWVRGVAGAERGCCRCGVLAVGDTGGGLCKQAFFWGCDRPLIGRPCHGTRLGAGLSE